MIFSNKIIQKKISNAKLKNSFFLRSGCNFLEIEGLGPVNGNVGASITSQNK